MEAAAVDRPITPARPVDVATVLSGIHRQARLTTRLHPRPGNPGPQDSSLGGPLAWPAGEAWPICPVPQEHALFADRIHPREPLPMVPVLQSTSSAAVKETVVIGIDGVVEATTLIDTAKSPLLATVIQDADRIANSIVDLFMKMQDGQEIPKRILLQATIHESC